MSSRGPDTDLSTAKTSPRVEGPGRRQEDPKARPPDARAKHSIQLLYWTHSEDSRAWRRPPETQMKTDLLCLLTPQRQGHDAREHQHDHECKSPSGIHSHSLVQVLKEKRESRGEGKAKAVRGNSREDFLEQFF